MISTLKNIDPIDKIQLMYSSNESQNVKTIPYFHDSYAALN